MSDIFLDVLNTSIAASWVVLAVLAARLVLRRAPRSILCALWGLVGIRLCWSPGFLESPFSLIPSTQTITPESLYDTAPVITSGVEIIDNVVNPVYTESFRTEGLASVNPLQVWTAIAANIWLLGMIAIWVWAIISWFRIRRRVAASVNLRDNIYLCDDIDTPFILGMFSPNIYLPSSLGEPQRGHVIAHEQAHIERMDFYYKPYAYFLLSIFWFNPMIWVAYILLCRDIELACDERVIKNMTAQEKKGYSTALLECSIHRPMIAACPLAFGEVGVKERIKAVLSYKKPAFWITVTAVLGCIVLAVCFLTNPVEKSSEIRYNGSLYVLEQQEVSFLPVEEESIGTLRSILHDTTDHPADEFQATNLDESLAGCPLYLEGNRLYLQKMDGTCIAFRMKTPAELMSSMSRGKIKTAYILPSDQPASGRVYTDAELDGLIDALKGLSREDLTPAEVAGDTEYVIVVDCVGEDMFYLQLRGDTIYLQYMGTDVYKFGFTNWKVESEAIYDLFSAYQEFLSNENPLGIHLSVEGVSSTGLILLCTQDGTLWNSIYTGSNFSIAKWDGSDWVFLTPAENTAWTMEARSVPLNETTRSGINWQWVYGTLEPGTYRIYKNYSGERGPVTDREEVSQSYYAEFTIE